MVVLALGCNQSGRVIQFFCYPVACCSLRVRPSPSVCRCRSRLGCQVKCQRFMDGIVLRIPSASADNRQA